MLHIKWPFGVKTNITYDETTQEVSPLCIQETINDVQLYFTPSAFTLS